MSVAIRIDAEVKRLLDAERKPGERNYNAAILRVLQRRKWLVPAGDETKFVWPSDAGSPE